MKRVLACILCLAIVLGMTPPVAVAAANADAGLAAGAQRVQSVPASVANGSYGEGATVRRIYTRPVTIKPNTEENDSQFRTIAIDLRNPVYDGADVAVRYTGVRPYLAFYDTKWRGWTNVYADDAHTVAANDGTGQHVAFFPIESIEARWTAGGGTSYNRECMSACVPSSGSGAGGCTLVEVVMLGGAARVNPTASASYHRKTGLTAHEIAREMQAGYNMAGHFESNYVPPDPTRDGGWGRSDLELESHWARGVYVTRDTIRNLKAAGFKAIRLPVTWFQHIYPADDPTGDPLASQLADPLQRFHIDRAWLERVHEVVDWCIAEDLYVIVNIHHEDWIDRGDLGTAYDDASTQLPIQFRAVWTQIADEFAGYDQHLVFEDMNEPHAPYIDSSGEENWGYATAGTVSTVNRLNADFVSLMRGFSDAGHRERLLMMPHDTDGGELSNTGFVLPSDPYNRIALSYHCYTPHSWTHYLFKKDLSVTGEDNVYTDTYRSDVETTWNGYRTQLTKYGCPIVLGEFGCYYCTESRQQDRLDWMAQYATHAKELGIPMFYWRMDRTVEQDGVEKVIWSAFDEVQQRISPLSSDMIAKWFEILNGDDIVWGENAIVEDGEHASLESAEGVQPTGRGRAATLPQTVKSPLATSDDEQQRILFNCTLAAIDGKEVAVKFTGNAPRLQVIGSNWKGGWWGISADTVDYRNGIAYYKDTSVRTYWQSQLANNGEVSGLTMDDVAYIGLRTADSGSQTATDAQLSTTVERVALVHRHEWGGWTHDMAASGDASVTDRRVCAHDASHVLVRTVGDFTSWQALEPATCTNGGIETRSYKAFPSYMQQRATAALGHSWNAGTVTVAPTATEPGVRTFTCTRCGEVRTEPIPATGETGEPRQGSEEASQPTPPEEPAVTSLAGAAVMLTATRFTYDGKAKAPAVKSVTLGAKTLSGNGDFTVSYSPGRTNAGTYTVSVRGTGAYEGVATATFTIEPKVAKPKVKLFASSCVYTGKERKPAAMVAVGSKRLGQADYAISYRRNVSVGKASATVSLKGNYTGSKSVSFKIVPQRPTIAVLNPGNRSFTAKWTKSIAQASGYKLRYSTRADFSNARTAIVASGATAKKTVRNLKPSTTYYVRLQQFKKSSSATCASDWSLTRQTPLGDGTQFARS